MSSTQIKIKGVGVIRKKEVIPFTRQMSSMLSAGMSILATVQTLEEQAANPEFKKVLTSLKESLEGGSPMSEGLRHFSSIFDEMYINMVGAGEKSGQFAPVLKRLASIMDSSAKLTRKVKSALTYPTVIICMALLMAGGLITFVVPVFADMFSGFGSALPGPTQVLVDISEFVKTRWYIIGGGVAVLMFLFKRWQSTPKGVYQLDEIKLRMPVFGELTQKACIGRFCRLLSQMLSSGVPILGALEIVAKSMGNHVLESSIMNAKTEVEQGNQLNTSLAGKPYLPLLMVRMIAAGEKAGRVEEMLDSIADTYDEEVEAMLATLTSMMEPFLMVFLGAIIGSIVIAMFLPIFKMGTVVG